jgi:hypothetical protein
MKKINFALTLLLALFFLSETYSQSKKEKPSPAATAMNTVQGVEVKIDYSQPAVKGRQIWGDLVPYDKVWRTGANEATVISFSKDVKVAGQALPAGKYSLFTIPGETEWTIIFNKEANQWGAYKYKKDDDALRIVVKPQKTDGLSERLAFEVDKEGKVSMKWEKLMVAFDVSSN